MSSMLPEAVAVDRPLKLGSAFLGTDINAGYYTLKVDFEPESLQQAQQADLLLLDEGQLKLIPHLPDGDCPFHFDGSSEQVQQRQGGDLDCVAYFDGNEWTLQLVRAHLRAKHRPGIPLVPGYNVDVPEVQENQPLGMAAGFQQPQTSSIQHGGAQQHRDATASAITVEHEIDPDLDNALEEALFATEKLGIQSQHTADKCTNPSAAAAQPPPSSPVNISSPEPPLQLQQQHHSTQQPHDHNQSTAAQQPQQQHNMQQPRQGQRQQPGTHTQVPSMPECDAGIDDDDDSVEDDSDDPWNTFDAAAAVSAPAPPVTRPAPARALPHPAHMHAAAAASGGTVPPRERSATPQPLLVASTASAARPTMSAPAAAARVAATPVVATLEDSCVALSTLSGDDDHSDEEDVGHGAQDCSEDESDGVGVEYF